MSSTKDIQKAVEAELDFDPLVDPTDITVKNLNGEVALNGTVPSYPQYLEAAAAAQRVEGVKRVHNHLMVQLYDSDYRDDAALTTAANNALNWDVTVPPGVEATARDGNLTLSGTVHFGSERTAAETERSSVTSIVTPAARPETRSHVSAKPRQPRDAATAAAQGRPEGNIQRSKPPPLPSPPTLPPFRATCALCY